jgi:hypothetical protein
MIPSALAAAILPDLGEANQAAYEARRAVVQVIGDP